jgi:hypothetical protein
LDHHRRQVRSQKSRGAGGPASDPGRLDRRGATASASASALALARPGRVAQQQPPLCDLAGTGGNALAGKGAHLAGWGRAGEDDFSYNKRPVLAKQCRHQLFFS